MIAACSAFQFVAERLTKLQSGHDAVEFLDVCTDPVLSFHSLEDRGTALTEGARGNHLGGDRPVTICQGRIGGECGPQRL